MNAAHRPSGLRSLCRLYGVLPAYRAADGARVVPPAETVGAVLRALGAPLSSPTAEGVRDALRHRRRGLWERGLPPSVTAWDGQLPPLRVRLPATGADGELSALLETEEGASRRLPVRRLPGGARRRVDGRVFATFRVRVEAGDGVPTGVHRLRLAVGERELTTRVVAAPYRVASRGAKAAPGEAGARGWGTFLPLYALRTEADGGVGDLPGLARLGRWTAARGGGIVGTLPLLPVFTGGGVEPSPYAPVSRLFWSELYTRPEAAPGAASCAPLQRVLASEEHRRDAREAAAGGRVDYDALARLRRRALAALAGDAGRGPEGALRLPGYQAFRERSPEAPRYAAFRAACARLGRPWTAWPAVARAGELVAGRDYDPRERDLHLYAQWLADRQLGGVVAAGRDAGFGLYLDLPLSAHPDGYDTWRHRELFAREISVGAPPDPFFRGGQDWGFPPPVPGRMRATGFAYLRACVRHHMRVARALRVDHVMGFHRMFWIPSGADARDGVYVRYPAREAYALLSLCAHRHGCVPVGEDLGTVPRATRRAMERHDVGSLFVVPFELGPGADLPLPEPPSGAVASLNTHDMWPFAAFWTGSDVDDRERIGYLEPEKAAAERRRRAEVRAALWQRLRRAGYLDPGGAGAGEKDPQPDPAAPVGSREEAGRLLPALLAWLGGSEAWCVLVNVEDLWLETEPQNVPGPAGVGRSWRKRAARSLEAWDEVPGVREALARLRRERAGHPSEGGETT